MKEGFVNRQLVRFVPLLVAFIIRIWFSSCRVTVHNSGFVDVREEQGLPVIASFWHYSVIYILYFQRRSTATAMVSASKDGDYLAGLAARLGFNTVRGSRNRKGVQALKSMLGAVKKGSNAALVADGSQGPPRKAQSGAVLIASKTGVPIVPIVWSASGFFTIRSWDRTAIPRPFSRIHYFYGEPIWVPGGVEQDGLEEYRRRLEDSLNSLYVQAWGKFDKTAHYEGNSQ
jgi:lysophospholipid acyltransferase (LPLAT)-like uncharacterized protein